MDRRVRAAARPSSSSAAHSASAAPAADNFLQVLPPERSYSAASALPTAQRNAPVVRAGSLTKPSRGAIVTETVKKAAYALSKSCLELEQLVLDATDSHSHLSSSRTDASISSRSTSAPPSGFFFTGVPGLEESITLSVVSPAHSARCSSVASAFPRSQSQPLSPSSPHLILQPKPESSSVSSDLVRDMQNLEDADLWCSQMLSKHQLQAALASLDLSDDDDDQGHLTDSPNHCDEQHDMQPLDAVSSAEEPIVALDAARFAVVEDLQCLLRSMQSAVDDQGKLLISQAELHSAAEAEEDRQLAERADAEVTAIHDQQQRENDEQNMLSIVVDDEGSSAILPNLSLENTILNAPDVNPAATSFVTAGLSFAIDCLGDEWAPADETSQQRQERHLKRAGICKIVELDNQLCAIRQRHRIITRTLASANGTAGTPSKRRTSSSLGSTLFSDKDRRLQQRLQRAADMCKNIEAPQLVSALQVKEEERVVAILEDCPVPRFGYDDLQQQRLLDIDRELLKIAAPDAADELIASFCSGNISAPISSDFSGTKARADAEASRFLQYEQQRRHEQARIKDVNAQLRSLMELERLTVEADALPPELPPGCRLVPKSRDDSAPLVVVAAPSAIQELLLDIKRAESLGDPFSWSTAHSARGTSRPGSSCSVLSAATAELDALLASRARSSASIDCYDHQNASNDSKLASPDKENEPKLTAPALMSSSNSVDPVTHAASARSSAVDEPNSVVGAAVCFAGTAVRRPSSSLKPPIPPATRAPSASSSGPASSSSASCGNIRSSARSEGHHTIVKPPSPLVPAASCGPVVRGKGWVAGVSDSLGLALSGVTSSFHVVPVKEK